METFTDRGSEQQPISASFQHAKNPKVKILKIASICILFMLVCVISYRIIHRRQVEVSGCSRQASSPLYDEAAMNMNLATVDKLKDTVAKIIATKGYSEDANCLYPVVYYYMAISDQAMANEYFKILKNVYDPNIKIAEAYTANAKTLDDVQAQITQLEKGIEQSLENRSFF